MMISRRSAVEPSAFIEESGAPFLRTEDAPSDLSPHYQETIGGLAYALYENRLNLTLARCGGPDQDPLTAMKQSARLRMCDGMVTTDMLVGNPLPEVLERTGLPFVVRGTSPTPNTLAVGMDNAAVGYEVVRYLHALGHRRILFLECLRGSDGGRGRLEGMSRAEAEFGLQDTLGYTADVEGKDAIYHSLLKRLQEPNIPTAVFYKDEISALGAKRALAVAGLKVPEDVSVMVCLNVPFMRLAAPDLTVLNVRQNESAMQACELLARLIRGKAVEKRQILLPPILEENSSTGTARDPIRALAHLP